MSFEQIAGVKVVVDDVSYMPTLQSPADKPFPFIYFITIINDSDETIQILGRKWIVEELGRDTVVVEGDGVIGEKPIITPGENFSYNSYHVVACNAEATGGFYGKTMSGVEMMVEIPLFALTLPHS